MIPLLLAAVLQCSEALTWDAVPNSLWYEVHRSYQTAVLKRVVDEGVVFSSKGRTETTYAPDGTVSGTRDAALDTVFEPGWGVPAEWYSRRPYAYWVAACNLAGCSKMNVLYQGRGK